ncbi:copper resistance protein CopC/CopD [Streptomyces sp. SID8352]|uniref:copper resistance protein CopC n=1 Tax=Streptomyces sp. SID8352 TaxID=2690338 RepID=UPI001368DDD1|nr:hypothetical protein [Streptomyces sp. SID8352]
MTQTIAPRVRILVLLLLAAACALLVGAGPAAAHAALTTADPAQGSVVEKAPARVTLSFSESISVDADSLRVLDPGGERVDTGDPTGSGRTYTVKLRPDLSDGTYTVAYQVVSADSHPVAGAYTFSIGAPSETTVQISGRGADDGPIGWLYGLGRYVSYAGFIVLAGGAAFVLACWPAGSGARVLQRLVVSGWLALTSATLLLLLLRGSYTGSGKAADILDLELLGQVLGTKAGAALVFRLLLLGGAALFVAVLFGAHARREEAERRRLTVGLAIGGTAVAAGFAASWALAEHASTGLQAGVAMPMDILHLLAVAAWFGGLTALLTALSRVPSETPVPASAVRRFSRVAFGSVVVLVVTGAYQSWRQLGSWTALTDTRYGQLLLAKLGLVAVLLILARLSQRWTGRIGEPVPAAAAAAAEDAAGEARVREEVGAAGADAGPSGAATGTDPDGAPGTASPGGAAGPDTSGAAGDAGDQRRAAQLGRQRAAVDAARRKRLRDADPHRSGLRRSVLIEAGVAVVLLAVTTALTQTEPGRTELEARAAGGGAAAASPTVPGMVSLTLPFDTGGADGRGEARIDLDPGRSGGNAVHLYVLRPDGTAYDVPEVKVAFTLKSKGVGPLPVVPDRITTGHWSASGVQIPMAGDWEVAVTVRTSDIDQVTVSKNAQIG